MEKVIFHYSRKEEYRFQWEEIQETGCRLSEQAEDMLLYPGEWADAAALRGKLKFL